MRTVFEANANDNGGDLFFFKGREFPTLLSIYARAQMTRVVRDYNIDGNGENFVCFSMLTDSRAKEKPVLSFEKSKDRKGRTQYKLHSRVSGELKVYEDSFINLSKKLESETVALQRFADKKVVRVKFGAARP